MQSHKLHSAPWQVSMVAGCLLIQKVHPGLKCCLHASQLNGWRWVLVACNHYLSKGF